MYIHTLTVLMFVNLLVARNIPDNITSIVTTYAKVANFGNTKLNVNEARSSGMSLYTQSSNAKVRSGQNLRSNLRYTTPSRVGPGVSEILPAKGEVVQERFNPRPYFDYLHVQPKRHETSASGSSKPSPVYGAPFDSFPVFKGSSESVSADAKPSEYLPPSELDSKPPEGFDSKPSIVSSGADSYSSTYDSYNPPMQMNEGQDTNAPVYPPIDSYSPSMSESGKDTSGPSNSYLPPAKPPIQMEMDNNGNGYAGAPYAPPSDDSPPDDMSMPSKEMNSGKNSYSEYSDVGPDIVPTFKTPHGSYREHSYQNYNDMGPKIINTVKPPESAELPYEEHPPKHHYHEEPAMEPPPMENGPMEDMPKEMPHGYHHKLPEYIDHDPKEHGYHHYPEYLHFDHHPVYHEITTTTTTTTEAPQERVNNNYSYYYLGRKLWYIPLYFSAYFILYITVLILKSIARHKVSFWHDLHNLGSSRRLGRNLELNELTQNVTDSIEKAETRYMM